MERKENRMKHQEYISKEQKHLRSKEIRKKRINKFLRNKLSVLGFIMTCIIIIACFLCPMLSSRTYDAVNISESALAPSMEHIFGTDKLGRDLFIRCMVGGRYSLYIGVFSALSSTLLGVFLGAVAGYFGGKIDALIIRLTEIFQSFPQMVLVMIMVAVVGRGIGNILIIFTATGWMSTARLVRNEFLAFKGETFVKVAEAFGMSKVKVMFKEILPNILTPIIVSATAIIPGYILSEASLSFLGVGVSDSIPTWGNIMNSATSLGVITNYWWMWIIPAALLTMFVLSVNFLGDGVRDLLDPR